MQSVLHVPSQNNNIVFTERILAKFGCMRDCADVCSIIGDAAAHRVRHAPLAVMVGPRETETNYQYITIGPGELILPDTSYYTDKSPSMVRTMEAFVKLLQWAGKQFNIEGLELVFPQEYSAAQVLKKSEDEREVFTTGAALEKHYRNFNWGAFVETAFRDGKRGMSLAEFRKTRVINARPSWMAALDRWLSAQVIFYHLPYLPPPFDDAHFRFFGARLRDQAEKLPQHKLAIYTAQNHLSAPLGELYMKEYAPRGSLARAKTLAEEVVDVAAERLGECAWLSTGSRREARHKVRDLALNIGIPRGGPGAAANYLKDVQLSSTGFIQNIYTLNAAAGASVYGECILLSRGKSPCHTCGHYSPSFL